MENLSGNLCRVKYKRKITRFLNFILLLKFFVSVKIIEHQIIKWPFLKRSTSLFHPLTHPNKQPWVCRVMYIERP